LFATLALAFGAFAGAAHSPADAAVTTKTPVMGPPILTAAQLKAWYNRHHGANQPRIPIYNNDVGKLAQVFIDEGKKENVRGDMAFVQSMLETGWLSFTGSQIPPDAYNYAGIYAYNGRQSLPTCKFGDPFPPPGASRCMGTPAKGVRTQIHLLRSYADPSAKTAPNRLISAPSDRAGMAPLWEYFGGNNCPCGKLIWASANDYGLRIIKMYSEALAESGKAGACIPYAPPTGGTKSGSGYWEVTRDRKVHRFGTAQFYGDLRNKTLARPLVGGESISGFTGYWLLSDDGGIFAFGSAKHYGSAAKLRLNKPVNGMERTRDSRGYWLVADDGGIFSYGNARFYGSMGNKHLNQPMLGMERTATGKGYWLFAADGGIFSYGDARFYGSLGSTKLSSPVIAMQRTKTGKGYWMMTAEGRIYRFGDAKAYGGISACKNLGGAARLLVTPTGLGYWIATKSGAIIPFGDARALGFPGSVGGRPIALMGAG
jgi:hypothetical protein